MHCPLCDKELLVIGDRGTCYSSEFKPPIGWDCVTHVQGDSLGSIVPHYSVRGARATVTLFPFKIDTWQVPEEYEGVSTVYHYLDGRGWVKVWSCPAISLDDTDKLLARLKLLIVFS